VTPGERAALAYELATQKDEEDMSDEEWFWDHYGHAEGAWEE
jgi:hypothetical protein